MTDLEKQSKGAILIKNRKGELIKWFKTWHDSDTGIATVRITYKDENGEKQVIIEEYTNHVVKGQTEKVSLNACVQAVIKYWPRFNPERHHICMSSGHFHDLDKEKTKKG